jgi:hypothetical protein
MRVTKFSRWAVRSVFLLGVGAAVFAGPVAANAAGVASSGASLHGVTSSTLITPKSSAVYYTPSDISWD